MTAPATRALSVLVVAAALALWVAFGGTSWGAGVAGARGSDDMMMVGNMADYPDLAHASRTNVKRARRLAAVTRGAARRLDTPAEAKARGYFFAPARPHRPGFTHMRKVGVPLDGTAFWGRIFDPRAPQSLVFWCPSHGPCRLAAYMYRVPGGRPPSTWGDLLQWHRHATDHRATWMVHVWLTEHTREALATCAPMDALADSLGIKSERYTHTSMELKPCKGAMSMPSPMR